MSLGQMAAVAANGRLLRSALVDDDLREDGRTTRQSRAVVVKLFHGSQETEGEGQLFPTTTTATPRQKSEQVTTCTCRLGETRAMATVSAEVGEPPVDRAHEGQLTVFVDASSCDPDLVSSEKVVEMSRVLDLLLKHSRAIDLESLCIIPARKCWCLRLDVRVLQADGNVMDACSIAAVSAAKAFTRPQYRLRDEGYALDDPYQMPGPKSSESSGRRGSSCCSSGIVPLAEREGLKLTVHHTPFTVCFVAFKKAAAAKSDNPLEQQQKHSDGADEIGEDHSGDDDDDDQPSEMNFVYAIDPTLSEEAIADAKVLVAADGEGYVRLVRKFGGCSLPKGDLTLLARLACIRAREIASHLEKVCQTFDLQTKQQRIRRRQQVGGEGEGEGEGKSERKRRSQGSEENQNSGGLGSQSRHFRAEGLVLEDFDGTPALVEVNEAKLGLLEEEESSSFFWDKSVLGDGNGNGNGKGIQDVDGKGNRRGGHGSRVGAPMGRRNLQGEGPPPLKVQKKEGKTGQEGKGKGEGDSPTHLRDAFTSDFLKHQ